MSAAFASLAYKNSAFASAAMLNTELLHNCTVDGLLAGGMHYKSHGITPCVHHAFSHSKTITFLLNNKELLKNFNEATRLPRSKHQGIKHFPELDVWLGSIGPWRSTVSSYDPIWK